MNIIEQLENEQVAKLAEARPIPEFQAGDTLRVHVKVIEGSRERIQVFEGVCIARKNNGVNSAFTVRKISYGEGVERVFPLYSPRIEQIEVVRRPGVGGGLLDVETIQEVVPIDQGHCGDSPVDAAMRSISISRRSGFWILADAVLGTSSEARMKMCRGTLKADNSPRSRSRSSVPSAVCPA